MTETKLDLLQGTLDLLVLRHWPHGITAAGIARQLNRSANEVLLNRTIYAFVRFAAAADSAWGMSDNNGAVITLTRSDEQLVVETANWQRPSAVITRVLSAKPEM